MTQVQVLDYINKYMAIWIECAWNASSFRICSIRNGPKYYWDSNKLWSEHTFQTFSNMESAFGFLIAKSEVKERLERDHIIVD